MGAEIGGCMDKQLYEALVTIRDHCASHIDRCEGCPLYGGVVYGCFIGNSENSPEYWELEQFETN